MTGYNRSAVEIMTRQKPTETPKVDERLRSARREREEPHRLMRRKMKMRTRRTIPVMHKI